MIGKRQNLIANDLACFVALAGDDQHIACANHAHSVSDGLTTIRNVDGAGRSRQDRGANGGGIFGTRIVVRHDDNVGVARGDVAHDGALASIAIAAATEHDDKATCRQRTQGGEHFFERIGLMRIIDEDWRALSLANLLQTTRRSLQMRKRFQHAGDGRARSDAKASGHQCVRRHEGASQRQLNVMHRAIASDAHKRGGRTGLRRHKLQKITLGARGEHAQATRSTGGNNTRRHVSVSVDHRRLAGREQRLEQAQLGGEIGIEV